MSQAAAGAFAYSWNIRGWPAYEIRLPRRLTEIC